MVLGHDGQFSELYFNVPLSFNGREKLLNSIKKLSHTGQNLMLLMTLSLQLEDNGSLKYSFENFPESQDILGLMENCWNYILMQHYPPITGRLTLKCMEPGSESAT